MGRASPRSAGRVKWNVAPARCVVVEPDAPAVVLDDLLAHRQADARARRTSSRGVQPLEDHEDPVGVARLDADAVVGAREAPVAVVALGRDRTRGGLVARNLIALPIRFWNTRVSSDASPRTGGRSPRGHVAPDSSIAAARFAAARGRRASPRRRALVLRGDPADAGERQQVVDQVLHALGAVDGELDVLVGALVELALVAPLEQLAEARDLAQRLLQVVRGDVGELLELGVRALRGPPPGGQRLRAVLELGDLAEDAPPHRVDVAAELGDLARAARRRARGRTRRVRRRGRRPRAGAAGGPRRPAASARRLPRRRAGRSQRR